jgi:hypothetical protein
VATKEVCKPVEIGERVLRPFDLYWSRHGVNVALPQVSSHRTTLS